MEQRVEATMGDEAVKPAAGIRHVLESLPTAVAITHAGERIGPGGQPEYVVVLSFSEKGFGFGEVTIVQNAQGVFVDTECTSKARVIKYLTALIDVATTDTDR